MAQEPDKSEKTEPPSPFKLADARKKGSVVKSLEVNSFFALTVALIFMIAAGEMMVRNVLGLSHDILAQAGQLEFTLTNVFLWLATVIGQGMFVISPLVMLMLLTGVIATLVQTGPVFSFFPIKPDLNRINPITGFKRVFSAKLIFETIKSLVKLGLYTAVVYVIFMSTLGELFGLLQQSPRSSVPVFIQFASRIIFGLLIIVLIMAIIDFLFSRWQYMRNLRMSKQEMKDEIKRREGDPHIKSKRRELQQELRNRGNTLGRVPDGDVVVTNPTHFAVVLQYDRSNMLAPKVIGKGADNMARKIREVAHLHGVPVIQDPPLARALFRAIKTDGFVTEAFYLKVAVLLRRAYALRPKQSAKQVYA